MTIKQCERTLDFKPRLQWPGGQPAIAYCSELWTGFNLTEDHPVWNWTSGDPVTIFKSCYSQLGLAELSRLILINSPHLPTHEILSAYNIRGGENTQRLMTILPQLPAQFQNWIDDRCLAAMELQALLSLKEDQLPKLTSAMEKIAELKLSRNSGAQILELIVELFLMGQEIDTLLSDSEPEWQTLLKNLRYPVAKATDDLAMTKVKMLQWPQNVQAKWQRKGDRAGLEIKFFAANPKEFERLLIGLERVHKSWQQEQQ
jgi:hypothetical protein